MISSNTPKKTNAELEFDFMNYNCFSINQYTVFQSLTARSDTFKSISTKTGLCLS